MKKNFLRIFLGLFLVFSCLAVTNFQTHASNGNEKRSAELSDLTTKIAELSGRVPDKNDLAPAEFENLAAERFARLSELAEKNPGEVLRVALPPDILAKIPTDMQVYFEKNADTEGEFEVIYECDGETEVLKYFIKTDKERLPVYFAKQPDTEIRTGSKVRIKGVRIGDALAAEDGNSIENLEVINSIAANTFGEQKVLVLLVNFQNDTRQPFTVAQANDLFFNTANSASITNFYREASYQQTWLTGTAAGWLTLPINTGDCNGTTTASAAKQAATNAGINISAYNRFVYVYPNMSTCNYSGIGEVNGDEAWINGSLYLRTVAHELGHNFGIYHSRSMDCGTVVVGGSCTITEYGNMADMMGYPTITGQFNAFQKERLGWMNYGSSPPITSVTTSGNYFITANSAQDSGTKALRVLQSSGTYYYIELRRPIGFDATLSPTLMNGVVITLDQPAAGKETYHLDMTPETTYWTDAALPVGRSYTDSSAGVTITPLSADNGGATVNISFGSTPPQTCILANPTVTASPTATQWIGAGNSVTYNVTVVNNNSTGCSANTFSLQNTVPNGWNYSAAPSLTVAPGAGATTTVQVLSPSSAANGFYAVGLGALNSSNAAYASSVTGNLAVYNSLTVAASSDRTSYNATQTVYLTANVSANGSPMAGANVTFSIKRPDGTEAINGTAVSNSSGIALFTYKFNRKKDGAGTYQVSASASLNGVSGTSSTSFSLVK
ncbi:MAG TPA: NEW3 domain-containing protein [Pyrinomonadaceae bacterium]|nr:NEW3 domain-containing protein [Pyrinomonadaceae bacterium]